MTKDETTKDIENAGRKIEKGLVRNPSDKDGTQQMTNQIKTEVKQENTHTEESHKHEPAHETKESKEEKKKPIVQKKPKKEEAVVMAHDLPISTKQSMAIGMFIKHKKIADAIADLEAVLKFKKVVPMKGEIPHRKGEGMMSGRWPQKATESFIKLLKSLSANADYVSLENPVIVEVVPNMGARPYGRFGAVRRKRTHVLIRAKEGKK